MDNLGFYDKIRKISKLMYDDYNCFVEYRFKNNDNFVISVSSMKGYYSYSKEFTYNEIINLRISDFIEEFQKDLINYVLKGNE